MRISRFFVAIIIIMMVGFASIFTLNYEVNKHRIMVKYGRQIPTAPIDATVIWHLKNGD